MSKKPRLIPPMPGEPDDRAPMPEADFERAVAFLLNTPPPPVQRKSTPKKKPSTTQNPS